MPSLLIRGAEVVARPPERPAKVDVLVRGDRVVPLDEGEEVPPGTRTVDAAGLLIAPGFIELQINGAAGLDFTTAPEAMWAAEVGEALARAGVTAFLATIVTAPRGAIPTALAAWKRSPAGRRGPTPLGLHLEGPFIAAERRGAHPLAHLRPPDESEAAGGAPGSGVRIVTVAPELGGALKLASVLAARGIVVSVGHSDADAPAAAAAADAGARYATHLFNAMRGVQHREPGLAAGVLADARYTAGVIADGRHVADAMIELAWQFGGPRRLSLVSDAMAGLGMPHGSYRLGTETVTIGADGARLVDGTLAGSVAGLDACVRRLRTITGCRPEEALATVTSVPADLLGLRDGRGRIQAGGWADLVALTPDLEVAATLVGGEIVHALDPDRWR